MSSDRNRQAETPKNPKVTQEHLATELVSKYGMKEGMTKNVPMSTSVKLVQTTEDNMLNKEAYRYIQAVCYIYGYVYVGSLLYLSVCTDQTCHKPWEFWPDTWQGPAWSTGQQPRECCGT